MKIICLDVSFLKLGSKILDNSSIRLSKNSRSLSISLCKSSNFAETPLIKGLFSSALQIFAIFKDSIFISLFIVLCRAIKLLYDFSVGRLDGWLDKFLNILTTNSYTLIHFNNEST